MAVSITGTVDHLIPLREEKKEELMKERGEERAEERAEERNKQKRRDSIVEVTTKRQIIFPFS